MSENKPEQQINKSITEPLPLISVPKEMHNLNIISRAGMLWDTQQEQAIERGNLIHLLLSKIKTIHDVDFAINDLINSGDLNNQNKEDLRRTVLLVVTNAQLKTYFSDKYKVLNECDIITSTGEILRPDRLNIESDNQVTIIDYKTGDQKSNHKYQLNDYEAVLKTMNYRISKKILVYINDSIELIVV